MKCMTFVVFDVMKEFDAKHPSPSDKPLNDTRALEVVFSIYHLVRSPFDSPNVFAKIFRQVNERWAAVIKD